MSILAWLLAEKPEPQVHWIWSVFIAALAMFNIVRGVLAIRNKRIGLKRGYVKEGKAAVIIGALLVVGGIAIVVIVVVVHFKGPLI